VNSDLGTSFKNLEWQNKVSLFSVCQYFDIGTGLLPFSITPSYAQSSTARFMLDANQGHADAFDLDADPESSAISPSDVPRLQNL
jgi:hypothetical protein